MLFKSKKSNPQTHNFTPTVPSGLIALTEKGDYYVKGMKRFKFISERARDSWGLTIVTTSEAAMFNHAISGVIGFRDGTLVKDLSDGKIYLISDSKRRHITNPDVLIWMGVEPILVSQKEISTHAEGEKLNG
jgi:hypothetical protein